LAYLNQEAGFCFLYPGELALPSSDTSASDSIGLYGPPYPPDSIEPVSVSITVTYVGPTIYVSDSAVYARMWVDTYMSEYPETFQEEPITLSGHQAAVIGNLPGYMTYREAFLVFNGYKYTLSLSPEIGAIPELDPLAQETWDTVLSSIVFFEPTLVKEVVRSENVCPQATADTQLSIDRKTGVCFLAPADATPDPLFPTNGYEIGPTGTHPNFEEVRTSLVVGISGPAQGKDNPRDAVPGILESGVEPGSVQDITLDGKPAIAFIDTDGPWWHRLTVVIANDTVYTINMNPYDEAQYPEMIADADRLWNTAIDSIAFFTPFK